VKLETHKLNNHLVIVLDGPLNLYNVDVLKQGVLSLTEMDSFENVIIDLGKAEYIDSSGIAALNFVKRKLSQVDKELFLYKLNDFVQNTLRLSGLGNHFKILEIEKAGEI
jgi:anti-anti-sigma factor